MQPIYFFVILLVAIAVANLLLILADSDSKLIYSSWMLIINSLIAAGLSMVVLIKERTLIRRDRTGIYFTIGLLFYFLANIVWGYYEIVLDIVSPVPSIADLFLMSAYGFLIYRLIVTYKRIEKKGNNKIIYITSIITGIFLAYILNLMISLTEVSNSRGIMLLVVTVTYPILNSILTVLALSILLNIKGQRHISVPWICELIGLLAIVVGDSWFAIIVLTAFVDEIWISAVLISSHYMMLAGGLVWYLRYSVKWNTRWPTRKNHGKLYLKSSKNIIISTIFVIVFSIVMGILYFSEIDITSEDAGGLGEKGLSNSGFMQVHGDQEIISIGAIVPLTGSLSSIGKPIVTSLQMAEQDINEYYSSINSTVRIKLIVSDSKTSPESTLTAIKQLSAAGVKVVVGPATSTAVDAVKDYAAKNNITLLSYASTSPALSIENDNLFRLVPDDKMQGKVIAEKMRDDGIKVMIPFWRADIYGNQLMNATKLNFENLGGKVDYGVKYKPHTGKFATSLHRINFIMWNQELKKLNSIVAEEISKHGPRSVAVYVVAFDEITPILIQAQLFDPLTKVRWYGSDSVAENHHIIKNIDSGQFALETNFTNPLYSTASENTKYIDFADTLGNSYHDTSITYPALAYDALWIAARTLEQYTSEIALNQSNVENTQSLNEILVDVAKSLDGVSGKINLNKAGDRISENYDFWRVDKSNHDNSYYWTKIGEDQHQDRIISH